MSATIPPGIVTALADRYVVERPLGQGGMATVYLARDIRHDRLVAVKVLRPELASSIGASRFLREVGIAARLQHPHVLTLIDSGEIPGEGEDGASLLYYVMPYVEGESLRERLARDGAVPSSDAVRLLREIVDALAYAHRAGLVHRDIKPENVLVSNGHALVVDFGIAKAISAGRQLETADPVAPPSATALTAVGVSLGTPAYMAPEQVVGDALADHRVDIYAVGVLGYEMLAGEPPFTGTAPAVLAAQIMTQAPALSAGRPHIPIALSKVITRCLEKDPALRFQDADALARALDGASAPAPGVRRATAYAAVAFALVVVAALAFFLNRNRQEQWARAEALPAIEQLVRRGEFDSAFVLAERVEEVLPGDSALAALWPTLSHRVRFVSDPAGAQVYRAPFGDTTTWVLVGTTPTDSVRVPASVSRYRIERGGYRPALLLAGGVIVAGRSTAVTGAQFPSHVRLVPASSGDTGMVQVAGPPIERATAPLADFLIDRRETTNREYKQFIDAGGYLRPELWTEPFVRDDRTLSRAEAMALFVDRTGRPGPALWEVGAPPVGEEDLPVGGVSWYEAMAYAAYRGKQLPTFHHWLAAAGRPAATHVSPGSTFDAARPTRANTFHAMSPSGAFDMAGNVREWTRNADGEGKRHIPGGGWTDPSYRFTDDFAHVPFDRSPINGIRLARYPTADQALAAATRPVVRAFRDYTIEQPVGDAEFRGIRAQYDYDARPFDARLDSRDTSHTDWIVERVSYVGVQGSDRIPATLYIPKRALPPRQTVVFMPGSNALYERSIDGIMTDMFGFLMRSGRTVVVPELRGMLTRIEPAAATPPAPTMEYRDITVTWGKEFRRTVDYLATRADVDSARFAYFGISLGGRLGGLMVAIEPRFRSAILYAGGFGFVRVRPEVDPLNFVPRVTVPVLMLNGRYDDVFPTETSQKPYFQLLGSPPAHKRQVVYDDGHVLPRAQVASETVAWLDRYLGAVRR